MTHFNFNNENIIEDSEIGQLYAIYGLDYESKPHFLITGQAIEGKVTVIDIGDSSYATNIYDEGDSALEVAKHFGLTSNLKFFEDEADFDITINF